MKSLYLSTWFKLFLLASDAATTVVLVSSYTFDPLNNSWKPSSRRGGNRSHQASSSSSSHSYAPPEPTPAAQVQFNYDADDIVSHHYTAFVGGNGEVDVTNPAFVPKQTLVEIKYNRRTGEVTLLDEEGVVTPEEYQRLKKAVLFEEEGGDDIDVTTASEQRLKSQTREEDVAVGETIHLDPEDLDPTDIIDTDSQPLTVLNSDNSNPAATYSQAEEGAYHYPQQLLDYPEPSVQWHASEDVDPTETFDSYSIPTETDNNYPVQQQQQQYQHYQYSQQPMQTSSAVAEPSPEQYYQQETAQQQAYEYYPATAVAEQPAPVTTEQPVEEYHDEATYRSSRGFGFAHRRGFFAGSE